MANRLKTIGNRDLTQRTHEQLVATVEALTPQLSEDHVRSMGDAELAHLGQALSEQRRALLDRARLVQDEIERRSTAQALERRDLAVAEQSAVTLGEIPDESVVGGRPTDG